MAAVDRPDGWSLDVLPIAPRQLMGGERKLVVAGLTVSGMFVLQLAPRAGAYMFPLIGVGIAFGFMWMALLCISWRLDPWMSRTVPRFLAYAKYMPAHSTCAVSQSKRQRLRANGIARR